ARVDPYRRERRMVSPDRVIRPGRQQRLRVEQTELAVRVGELEQIPADGTHRHNVDQRFGDHGPSSLCNAAGVMVLTKLTLRAPEARKVERPEPDSAWAFAHRCENGISPAPRGCPAQSSRSVL